MQTPDIVALIVVALVGFSFWKLHRDPASTFNVFDLVMDGGRLSRMACVFVGAFFVCSWIMVKLTLDAKMTDGYFLAYGGIFVTPIVAKLFSGPPPSSSTIMVTSKTVDSEPAPAEAKKKGK